MKVIDSAGLVLGQHRQPYRLSVTFTPPPVNEGLWPSQEAESLWKEAECIPLSGDSVYLKILKKFRRKV